MFIITSDTQLKIIEAYFRILQENPDVKKITLGMVACKAGMRRESVYRYHFKNVEKIKERVHYLIDNEIEEKAKEFFLEDKVSLMFFFNKQLLPLLYKRRDWLKILYGTDIDAGWNLFLVKKYTPLIESYLNRIGKRGVIPNSFLASLTIKEFLSITSTWLTEDNPEPASLFEEKFSHIIQRAPYDLLGRPTNN